MLPLATATGLSEVDLVGVRPVCAFRVSASVNLPLEGELTKVETSSSKGGNHDTAEDLQHNPCQLNILPFPFCFNSHSVPEGSAGPGFEGCSGLWI